MKIFITKIILATIYFTTSVTFAEPNNIDILKQEIIQYVASGTYNQEVANVIAQAQNSIDKIAVTNQRRSEPKKLAIVLDIDETVLSNYADILKHQFVLNHKQWTMDQKQCHAIALNPTLKLYQDAIKQQVAIFFVTGRKQYLNQFTINHLKKLGYDTWDKIYFKPNDYNKTSAAPYKTNARIDIEKQGYTIIANIGDQNSDLAGGHAEHTYKLPNPFYLIP